MIYANNVLKATMATAVLKPRSLGTAFGLVLLSVLMALYAPMASISHAQAANDYAEAQKLKQKVVAELDKRISKYENLYKRMQTNTTFSITVDNNGVKTETTTDSKYKEEDLKDTTRISDFLDANPDINKGIDAIINFPIDVKHRVHDYMKKIIDELTKLKQTVKDTNSAESLKTLTKNIDAQQSLTQLAQVQAAVTQSTQSLTAVYNNVVATLKNVQTRQDKVVECIGSIITGKGSISTNVDVSGLNITTGDIVKAGPGCDGIDAADIEAKDLQQAQIDTIKTLATTVGSVLSSSTTLLMTLISQFETLVKNLGDYGMENLTKIGTAGTNVAQAMDLKNLFQSSGTVSGLQSSTAAIATQLDTANDMSSDILVALQELFKS